MSRRETVLCDVETSNWNGNSVTCGELSAGKCILCQRDICTSHLLHPKGGMLLRCDSIIPGVVQNGTQDLVYAPGSQQITPYPQVGLQTPMVRLMICAGCRRGLNDHDIFESLKAIEKKFIELLGAAISAKALETRK